MPSRTTRPIVLVPPLLLAVAAVAYSGVLWEALLGFPLSPSASYLSELAALDRPYSALFRALDASTALLVLIALAVAWFGRTAAATPRSRWVWFSAAGLALFAVGTLADSASPMVCATSVSAACAAGDAAGTLGFGHELHSYTSVTALTGAIVAAVGLAMVTLRARRSAPKRAARGSVTWAFLLAALLVVVTAVVTAYALAGEATGALPEGGGYAQRAQTLLISLLLLTLARAYTRAYTTEYTRAQVLDAAQQEEAA